MPPVLPISLLKMRRMLPHLVLGVNLNRPPRSSRINDRSAMQNQTEDEQNDERQDENTKTSQKDIYDHSYVSLLHKVLAGHRITATCQLLNGLLCDVECTCFKYQITE